MYTLYIIHYYVIWHINIVENIYIYNIQMLCTHEYCAEITFHFHLGMIFRFQSTILQSVVILSIFVSSHQLRRKCKPFNTFQLFGFPLGIFFLRDLPNFLKVRSWWGHLFPAFTLKVPLLSKVYLLSINLAIGTY